MASFREEEKNIFELKLNCELSLQPKSLRLALYFNTKKTSFIDVFWIVIDSIVIVF